jgi:hypothetical protein
MLKGLGGSKRWLELFGAENNFLFLSEIELGLLVVQPLAWSMSQFFVLQNTVGATLRSYRFFQYILSYALLELKVNGDSYILTLMFEYVVCILILL